MAIKEFIINGQPIAVEILEQHPAYFKFKINEKIFEISLEEYDPAKQILNFVINNHPVKIKYSKQQNQSSSLNKKDHDEALLLYIINHCAQVLIEPVTPKLIKQSKTHDHGAAQDLGPTQNTNDKSVLKSPLAGRIVKVLVNPGDHVSKNQLLVIIESMKMENEIRATFPGFIKNVSISEGNLVQQNQVLITFGS